MHMDPRRAEALKLRLKGKSYSEIYKVLSVPKSTLSGWFKNVILSENARERLALRAIHQGAEVFIKRNKLQTHKARARACLAHANGKNEIPPLTPHDLKIVGAALYWAEGYKRPRVREGKERTEHPISFVNTDPEMVRIFIRFLTETMCIEKDAITLSMRLYPHINEAAAIEYWMQTTGLLRTQF